MEQLKSASPVQILVSKSLAFCDTAPKELKLPKYHDPTQPCLFVGLYTEEDMLNLEKHNSFVTLLLCGSDGRCIRRFKDRLYQVKLHVGLRVVCVSPDLTHAVEAQGISVDCFHQVYLGDSSLFNYQPPKMLDFVYCYVPWDRREEYGLSVITEVAKQLPDKMFILARWGDHPKPFANCMITPAWLPREELASVYKLSSCCIRPILADGFPATFVEESLMGRPCAGILDYGVPWVKQCKTTDEFVKFINESKISQDLSVKTREFINDKNWMVKSKKPHIRLTMIVKNESHCITRALASVEPLIDSYCILDTGSTDGTPEKIKEFFGDRIPGEVHLGTWKGFGESRTESLELSRKDGVADYLMVFDADDEMIIDPGFTWPDSKTIDAYSLTADGGVKYTLQFCFNARSPWKYVGKLHAYPACDKQDAIQGHLDGLQWHVHHEGNSWKDPEKYKKAAIEFQKAVEENPGDTRSWFYLGQSHRDAGNHEESIKAYAHRAILGGWKDEVFYSIYQVALQKQHLKYPWDEVASAYLSAYAADPMRPEPLYRLGQHYSAMGQRHIGSLYLLPALNIIPEEGALFLEWEIPKYLIPLEAAVCLYWTGRYQEAADLNNRLLSDPDIESCMRDTAKTNLAWCLKQIEG